MAEGGPVGEPRGPASTHWPTQPRRACSIRAAATCSLTGKKKAAELVCCKTARRLEPRRVASHSRLRASLRQAVSLQNPSRREPNEEREMPRFPERGVGCMCRRSSPTPDKRRLGNSPAGLKPPPASVTGSRPRAQGQKPGSAGTSGSFPGNGTVVDPSSHHTSWSTCDLSTKTRTRPAAGTSVRCG